MNDNVKISILIPCYNVEKYLDQCISSVIGQTIEDIEIICINDGSTDKTLEILKRYKSLDRRIKIINKKNTGYGDSMNCALNIAQGEYIGIVESDDFVEPNMFESLYKIAICENSQITRCCYYEYKNGVNYPITNSFVKKNKVYNPNIMTDVFWQAPAIWASIYLTSWINKNNIRFLPTPGASYQDTSFVFKAYACCEKFFMTDKAYIHYRIDNFSSSINSKNKIFCVCDEWNEIYKFVLNNKKNFGHLLKIMPALQYATYKWNLKRLNSNKYKLKFLSQWIKEWIIRFVKGDLHIYFLVIAIKHKIIKKLSRGIL